MEVVENGPLGISIIQEEKKLTLAALIITYLSLFSNLALSHLLALGLTSLEWVFMGSAFHGL